MDLALAQTISITVYKLCSLLTGVILSYLGYRLFMAGIWGNAGSAEGKFSNAKVLIKKAAPGTFFVIMGAIVICATIFKGLDLESRAKNRVTKK